MKSLILLTQCLSPVYKVLANEDTLLFQHFRALFTDPWERYFHPKENALRSMETLRKLSTHHDGYLRETAVKKLVSLQGILALGDLLERVNDWVSSIHQTATLEVRTLLLPENVAAFIAHLPQIRHLLTCERYDHSPLVREISFFLTCDDHLPILQQALRSADHAVSLAILLTLIDQEKLTDEAGLLLVLKNRDPRLRSLALTHVLDHCLSLSEPLIGRLLRDRCPRIRRDTLAYLERGGHPLPESLHTTLLLDKNRSIQQRARLMLAEKIKAIPFWLQVVTTPIWTVSERCRALHALKEARYHELYSLALWGYEHVNHRIRQVSLQILLMHEGEDAKEHALLALTDPSFSFAMATLKHLKHTTLSFSMADVQYLLVNSPSAKHSLLYWRLMHRLNKWDWLILLLHHSSSLSALGRENELAIWKQKYNHTSIYPTAAQREMLEAVLLRFPAVSKALQNWLV